MKYFVLSLTLVLLLPSMATSRLIGFWSFEKLYKESDLVAIVELESVSESKDKLNVTGRPDRYVGKIAQLTVGKVLKGKADTKTIRLLHFAYAKKVNAITNGALFIDFSDAEKYHYLVFLKQADQGTFIPVRGHYDAGISVKKIIRDVFTPIKQEKKTQPKNSPDRR